jgi:hypothetical protein
LRNTGGFGANIHGIKVFLLLFLQKKKTPSHALAGRIRPGAAFTHGKGFSGK